MQVYFSSDELGLLNLGAELALASHPGEIIFLQGPLGAGKTTLVRGFFRALGYQGTIKSPTYTLVESYLINNQPYFHFDLYRLAHPHELFDIGFEDYLQINSICLIEWPEKAKEILPKASISCRIEIPKQGVGRKVFIQKGR